MTNGISPVEGRLERLGFYSEREHLRTWLGQRPRKGKAYGSVLSRLTGLREDGVAGAGAYEGRVLSILGDWSGAAARLDAAVKADSTDARAASWRGELSLLTGDAASALKDLDAAVRLDPKDPWVYAYRAAALFRLGDFAGSEKDIASFSSRRPGSAAGFALKAVLDGRAGKRLEAEECLKRAVKLSPEGWVYSLSAAMRSRWGDLWQARRDIDRAVETENSPWARMERAEIAKTMGEFWVSLRDLKVASRALPQEPAPLLRAAAIQLDQAKYAPAVRSLSQVLAITPKDAHVYHQRGKVRLVAGQLEPAQRDMESACRLAPEDPYLRQDLVWTLILRDRFSAAGKMLAARPLPAGAKEFWLGYMACRRKEYEKARGLFEKAQDASAGRQDGMSDRAGLYAWIARLCAAVPALGPAAEPEVVMIGLGYRQIRQLTLGALQALKSSDSFYCNHSDPNVREFLGLFPAAYRAVVFRGSHLQAVTSSRAIIAGSAPGRRVGFVTRAQPIVYGRLAYRVERGCRRQKIGCAVAAAVSIFDILPGLADDGRDAAFGLQVRDSRCLQGIRPGLGLVVYLPNGGRQIDLLVRALKRLYPPAYPCFLTAGAGKDEFSSSPVALSGLASALERSDPACMLYIPPLTK